MPIENIHTWAWIYLIVINIIAFCFYGFDKHQARRGKSRIPEKTLHGLTLLAGTAGAFLGQIVFHHKTKKLKFRVTFISIVIVQAGLILLWIVYHQS